MIEHITYISYILALKLDPLIEVNEEQSQKIWSILVTLLVLKLDKLIEVNEDIFCKYSTHCFR